MTEYLRARVVREDGDDPDGPLRIIAATGGRKADGLNLSMDRADLKRFESNPVVMYGHDYFGRDSLPIGRSESTTVDGDKLLMDVRFDRDDPFAVNVERKYRAGYMNTFSIGFDAYDIDEAGVPARWELHEVSAVPIPMDPDAVVARQSVGDLAGDERAVAFARALVAEADQEPDDEPPAASDDEPPAERGMSLATARRLLDLHEAG